MDNLRASNLDEIVGLQHVKNILKYDILGNSELGRNLPHYIISGPPGTGKSSIATIISNLTGGEMFKYLGSDIKKPDSVFDMALIASDNDVIYIEEAHSINKNAQIVLLEWLENYKLLSGGEAGGDAPKVSFIFPTTNPGKILKPLRERCKSLHTSYYTINDIKLILTQAGRKFGLDLSKDDNALTLLAQSSRGTPRTAICQRLDMLTKIMAIDKREYNYDSVKFMLDINRINDWGLEPHDIDYCNTLYDKIVDNNYRPISKKIMQQCLGFDEDTLDIIEGYLQQINVIRIEPRGRFITPFGCELINKAVINNNSDTISISTSIDMNKLSELINDGEFRKKGMKAVCEQFGLKYGRDNHIVKNALAQLGASAKQKVGIVFD